MILLDRLAFMSNAWLADFLFPLLSVQGNAIVYFMVQFSNQFNFLKLVYFFKTGFIFFKPVHFFLTSLFFLNQFIYQRSEKGFHILGCGEK